jgi:two-component system NtrC family sensor kinase
MWGWLRESLAAKLMVSLVASMALIFGVFSYMNLRSFRRQSQEMVLQNADHISDLIRRSLRYSMLRNQREEVFHIINTIGRQSGIGRIRIFNKEGQISYSTDAHEVGAFVDKQAEACYACHAQAQPLQRLDRPDRMRTYRAVDGTRVLGLISPIENEPDCSNAACHAHAAGNRVLGVLDTNLSLASVDASIRQRQRYMAFFTVITILSVSLISAAFIWAMVRQPVRQLMEGTRHVAGGNLDYSIPVTRTDEIGTLAASFNNMVAQLKSAHQQIMEWTRTLEARVDEKTRELDQAYYHLIQSEKMASLGKLAAVVAHEINNPLAGILTYCKLTSRLLAKPRAEAGCPPEAAKYLQVIEGESRRCGTIVKNLLTFARQAPLNPQKNDLTAIVERCLLLVEHQLELQSIDLVKSLDPQVPAIFCDASQVQQALLALLVNAGEAMAKGGRLTVATSFDAAGRLLRIQVSDEGPPIPADILPHIFEPFFTTKEAEKGVGLGLAIAFGIAQQHGGNIEVVSTREAGTTFTLVLPEEGRPGSLGKPAAGAPAVAAAQTDPMIGTAGPGGTKL